MALQVADAGVGVMLPSFDPFRLGPPPLVRGARLAEELGFDSGWVGDHLSFHPPVLDALCALSAAAAGTERLLLGAGVLLLPLRNPVWTAKQVATVATLAPGRVLLGAGVGGENPAEFEAAGVPVTERGARLDESVQIIAALLRGDAVDHPGPLLPTRSPALEPVPDPVPLIIGGRSDAGLRRAARVADGWLGVWTSPDRLRRAHERLRECAEQYGRPPCTPLMMVFTHVTAGAQSRESAREEAARFVAGQYGLPLAAVERWSLIGGAHEVAEGLAALRAAGAAGFVLFPAAADPLTQYERLATVRGHLDG
ncbi:LLM class flavin-dependent oxidoreductase [Pseudonocardia acidicola]|uniref:LLM class flavin-dependent oxidoreductase n=1 Tax=Pseudonocardia acidicola TaxID=2724939 RepID=A0ABX1S582_9PSEU|nr:LLM class flavin-dependent oxidoreductase [Pseudonocardia acidicola]NMH95932.1 LLM class flavin-dependent oxidoreductase [Pseudonocardia acidicola]